MKIAMSGTCSAGETSTVRAPARALGPQPVPSATEAGDLAWSD
ncbi:hypothetical protein ACFWZ2_17425 [Streptomyces sp. NPDC059002]